MFGIVVPVVAPGHQTDGFQRAGGFWERAVRARCIFRFAWAHFNEVLLCHGFDSLC